MALSPCTISILRAIIAIPGLKDAWITLLSTIEAQLILLIAQLELQIARLNIAYTITQAAFNAADAAASALQEQMNYLLKPLNDASVGCTEFSNIMKNIMDVINVDKKLNNNTLYNTYKQKAKNLDLTTKLSGLQTTKQWITDAKDWLVNHTT